MVGLHTAFRSFVGVRCLVFRESARTCPIARRACARWRLAKVTRKPNSHLNRLEGATPASISRRPRSPSLAGGSRRACDSDIAFLGRSALLAAGRGSEAPGATSRRTAFGSEWRAISGSVVDDHRTRPRASPFAFRPARRAHRLPTPTRHGPRKACDQGVQGVGWRGPGHPPVYPSSRLTRPAPPEAPSTVADPRAPARPNVLPGVQSNLRLDQYTRQL